MIMKKPCFNKERTERLLKKGFSLNFEGIHDTDYKITEEGQAPQILLYLFPNILYWIA